MKKLLWNSWAWLAFAVFIAIYDPANPIFHTAIICGFVAGVAYELSKGIKA